MSRILVPDQDALFLQWIQQFASVAVTNATTLGLTAGQTTTLTALATAFETAYEASQEGKITAKGLVATKDNARSTTEAAFRGIAKVINANGNISVGLKNDLGIDVTPPVAPPVVPPINLVVTSDQIGQTTLTWKRNGNASGTAYLIERKVGLTGPWIMINMCTKLKFVQNGQIPGEMVWYRVSAKRGDLQSVPCAPTTPYLQESSTIILHEAA